MHYRYLVNKMKNFNKSLFTVRVYQQPHVGQ